MPVTPSHVQDIIERANSIANFVFALLGLIIALAAFILLNILVIYFYKFEMCSIQPAKKCGLLRFIFAFFVSLACGGCILKLIMIADARTVEYLAVHACSNDDILNRSFVTMNNFLEGLMIKNWITIGILILLLAIDLIVFFINTVQR